MSHSDSLEIAAFVLHLTTLSSHALCSALLQPSPPLSTSRARHLNPAHANNLPLHLWTAAHYCPPHSTPPLARLQSIPAAPRRSCRRRRPTHSNKMAEANVYKSDILKACRQSSLSLEPKASDCLGKFLLARFGPAPSDWVGVKESLNEVLGKIKESESGMHSTKLTVAQVEQAISALNERSTDVSNAQVIDVISAYDQPRFHYDTVRKVWFEVKADRSKFGVAEEKADMLRSRYSMLLQRIQRLPAFQPQKALTAAGAAAAAAAANAAAGAQQQQEDETPPLCTIESLMGQSGRRVIFGQLCQLTEGVYSLEDIHSNIRLDLSSPDLVMSSGLFTEGCMVLVEGEVADGGAFRAATLIQPPAEPKNLTIKTFPALDYLLSDMTHSTKNDVQKQLKLQLIKSPQHANDMIVVLSEVYLDLPETLQKIAAMLEGLKEHVPPAFVFMGNFTSQPCAIRPGEMEKMKGYFNSLCDVLTKFPSLCRESHFVFIPGPRDLPMALGSCLPCPPLPAVLTTKLKEKLSHVTFGSNPCRMSWVSQELVFFREDLLHKLRRGCIRPPSEMETADASQHLVKTVLDQAHLCPLPLDKRPVYWNLDHALRLYPLPDVLVLADVVDQYEWPYTGVRALNPGSFAQDGAFVVYYPARSGKEGEPPQVEFSRVQL